MTGGQRARLWAEVLGERERVLCAWDVTEAHALVKAFLRIQDRLSSQDTHVAWLTEQVQKLLRKSYGSMVPGHHYHCSMSDVLWTGEPELING